jgi:hypothetical protein
MVGPGEVKDLGLVMFEDKTKGLKKIIDNLVGLLQRL